MSNESRPLRLLMVAPRYTTSPQGGVAMYIYQVGPRLVRAGIDVTILATDTSGQLPAAEESEGMHILRVRAYPAHKDYFFAPGLYHAITRGDWDLVHCQGYNSLIPPVAMFAAWRAHIPYMLTFHSAGDVSRFRKSIRGTQRMILRPLLARAEKLIAVSAFEAAFFQERMRLPAEQFAVISIGTGHLPKVAEPTEEAEGAKEAKKGSLILSFGRLERYKGFHRVIAAMPKVLEQVPDAQLRIAGVGPYEPALRKMASRLGVADRVEIRPFPPGDFNGAASLIASADLVTLLSEYEAQPQAVMEALSLKRSVLVAGTSGLQEFADRGLARSIALESKPEEVAAAVVDQLRRPLDPGNVALPTWEECAANLVAVYQSVACGASKMKGNETQ
jgi:glycosyltransferase involved in cell wall biosynthesis